MGRWVSQVEESRLPPSPPVTVSRGLSTGLAEIRPLRLVRRQHTRTHQPHACPAVSVLSAGADAADAWHLERGAQHRAGALG